MYAKNSNQPSDYDFFTAADTKSADLTIYYNIALDSIEKIKQEIKYWPASRQNGFWAEYLWKAHIHKKNSNGYEVNLLDETIIQELFKKLEAIRNFHSHIWHDNEVLSCEPELKGFIEQKYEEAKADLYKQYPADLLDYETMEKKPEMERFRLFKWIPDKRRHFITVEGRIFLLTFFLTTGQMNQLLQQRKGFKRSDMPLFKIKRLLYTYYCHRDGASMADFNHEERFMDAMDEDHQRDITKARTAYKLLSYLYDYPSYWGSRETMPLYDEYNQVIKDVQQLKQFIEKNTHLFAGFTFRLLERKVPAALQFDSLKEKEAYIKHEEDKHRKGTIAFSCDTIPGYLFHIDFDTLHRLVLLQILHRTDAQEPSPVDILQQNLKIHAQNRLRLYEILMQAEHQRNDDDRDYLLDKKNQQLRGSRKLTEMAIMFFEANQKGEAENKREAVQLANYIRSEEKKWIEPSWQGNRKKNTEPVDPEPIHVYQQDFVLGTSQKFRSENRFVQFTARYLMDFAGDNWYWGVEKFEMAKKDPNARTESLLKVKKYVKASDINAADDYRLTIENDHVYLGVIKNENATVNHERFYQFSIGPRAMRYLAAFVINHKQDTVKIAGFLQALASDLDKLSQKNYWHADDGYNLLEQSFVAGYLHYDTVDTERLKKQVQTRIEYIINGWNMAIGDKSRLSRSEKNKMVMDAYRFFEWPQGNDGKPRFLRAGEFNEMSVCHYSLHLKDKAPAGHRTRNDRRFKSKFDYLFEDLFGFTERKPPIPREIRDLLNEARSLDELMELTFSNRSEFLRRKFSQLTSLPAQLQKRELTAFCRLLGISVPANLLRDQEKENLKIKHAKTLSVLPYAIDPLLIIKYFFPEHYAPCSKTDKRAEKRAALPVFLNLRKNKSLRDKLYEDFYDTGNLCSLYTGSEHKKQREALTGIINTTCTEDILLWWMAGEYLSNNRYTEAMGEYVKKQKNTGRSFVGEFHKLPVAVAMEGKVNGTQIFMEILMHQLDDLMFMVQKSRLVKAAEHFLNRCKNERLLWEADLQAMQQNQLEGKSIPDGSVKNPIPFKILIAELELVRRTGQQLAGYILDFEKAVLSKALANYKNKNEFHQWLKSEYQKTDYSKVYSTYFFNFECILKLAVDSGIAIDPHLLETLSELRNITFHNDIPVTGSFSWITRQGEPLRQLLSIESDLHGKKDRSGYIKGSNE